MPTSGTSQIVYSPHDYGPVVSAQSWFEKDFTEKTLLDDYWYDTWAYLVEKDMYPLLIGEWGGRLDGGDNEKWMGLLRDYMIKHHINHTFWCLNDDSGDTGGLWKDIQFGVTRAADGSIQAQTTINWDTEKYDNYYYPSIWKTQKTKKFIGLDHQVALGSNGISLSEFYSSYANTEGSNLDGGTVGGNHGSEVTIETQPPVVTTTAKPDEQQTTTTVSTTKQDTPTTTPKQETTTEPTTARQRKGDANEDGLVDVTDAVLICRYGAEDPEAALTTQGKINANVNGDNKIDADDAAQVLQHVAKLIKLE